MTKLVSSGNRTLMLTQVDNSESLSVDNFDQTSAARAVFYGVLNKAVAGHGGIRSVESSGDTLFVAVFEDVGDAVACALEVQRVQLGRTKLRVGVHTCQVPPRDNGGVSRAAISCAARLHDLARGGQILLSGSTEELVADRLPDQAWLVHLGSHRIGESCEPQRVSRLYHPDLRNECASLRAADSFGALHLPVQLTSFVGRDAAISELRQILTNNHVVTLIGVGGVGKTRLAIEVAAEAAAEFGDGVRLVDLASITDPDVVGVAAARALGLPDQPGRSTTQTLTGFLADRHMLVVLDNCEHLLEVCAALIVALRGACRGLKILATSREPLAVPGEVIWQVPSLSLLDEAIELFYDRARRSRPSFTVTDDTAAAMMEICRRLDGLPLAIELAAARVRTLSMPEILDSLHDRFRILTGGARTAMRRQQTLRACFDWSYALLSEPEKVLFRRLAVFMGGFDSTAAKVIIGDGDIDVVGELSGLVDKSLVIANVSRDRTRYRLLETVRLYARDKLAASGEADAVRGRHHRHYLGLAIQFDTAADSCDQQRIEPIEAHIDNLRAAFGWSCARRDIEAALQLATSLQPLWSGRGRIQEGLAWFDTALTEATTHDIQITATLQARAMADKATLVGWIGATDRLDLAERSLRIARDIDDPALLARALAACVTAAAFNPDVMQPYFTEAVTLTRALGDDWRLSQILGASSLAAYTAGDPIAARAFAEEGRELAEAIGDGFISRCCRWCLAWAQFATGDPGAAAIQFQQAAVEAEHAQDTLARAVHRLGMALALAHNGDTRGATAAADAAIAAAAKFGGEIQGLSYAALAVASMAAGDVAAADEASEIAWRHLNAGAGTGRAAVRFYLRAELALIHGDPAAARRWADEAVAAMTGFHLTRALTTRARVAIAQSRPHDAERFARKALTCAGTVKGYLGVPDIIECLAQLAVPAGKDREAARLFGAAQSLRDHMSVVRFKIYDDGNQVAITSLRTAMAGNDFDSGWAEGAALSVDEILGYVQRGRGERKRPASGWESLTPTERAVVRLVSEGLTNKGIGTKLFVSHRTVQTHLTNVYTKLGLTSRVQLAQGAASHMSQ